MPVYGQVDQLVSDVRKALARGPGQGLSLLVCNAAVFQPGQYKASPDGIEQTLAIDYYAHVELINGLLPDLERGAPSRIILQASQAEQFGSLDFGNLKASRGACQGGSAAAAIPTAYSCDRRVRRRRRRCCCCCCSRPPLVSQPTRPLP